MVETTTAILSIFIPCDLQLSCISKKNKYHNEINYLATLILRLDIFLRVTHSNQNYKVDHLVHKPGNRPITAGVGIPLGH